MEIHEKMTVYKDKDEIRPVFKVIKDYERDQSYESMLTIAMHTGTHIDAPLHMIKGGNTIGDYDLRNFITKCKVVDFTDIEDKITRESLENIKIDTGDFILFKTRNSFTEDFDFKFVYLDKYAARYLVEMNIAGVGIDSLGIEREQPEHDTHKQLLGHGIIILEGIRLQNVDEGEYTLYAPPLRIRATEASPTRAILIKE